MKYLHCHGRRVCAVIITYFPQPDFKEFLLEILEQYDEVMVVDNGSTGAPLEMLQSFSHPNLAIYPMGKNTGLGTALNFGIRQAILRDYKWVTLFDQDSRPLQDMIKHFSNVLSSHPAPERIAVIGSKFQDRNKRRSPSKKRQEISLGLWTEKQHVITSGSFISVDAYEKIGPFREDFFIDSIDHEYCFRAKEKGWLILQTTAFLLSHSIGSYRQHRFLWMLVWRSHHSALRCYFMARNRMLLAREYGQYGKIWRDGCKVFKNSFFVFLFEDNKIAKIRAIWSGYCNGVMNRVIVPDWIKKKYGLE